MKSKASILAVVVLFLVVVLPLQANERKLLYRSFDKEAEPRAQVDETEVEFLETKDGGATILRQKQTKTCKIRDEFILDKDYSLSRWSRRCPEEQTDFIAEVKDDTLFIAGTLSGKPVEKQLPLEGKYLHIYPNYSLGKFAFSGAKTMKFWSMRRDELELLPMQAKVVGEEMITLEGKEVETVRVYFSITGKLREKHFNHNYFYRKSDGVYLKKIQQDGEVEILVKEK